MGARTPAAISDRFEASVVPGERSCDGVVPVAAVGRRLLGADHDRSACMPREVGNDPHRIAGQHEEVAFEGGAKILQAAA